jgi:hypothetical protein
MKGMRWMLPLAALLLVIVAVLAGAGGVFASNPASQTAVVPAAGSTTTLTWTGTIPAATNPTSDCTALEGTPADAATIDHHTITIQPPSTGYTGIKTTFTFQITWTPSTGNENTNDEILTVLNNDTDGEVGSSDGSSTTETVASTNLGAGTYDVMACGFINALPQDYTGTLTMTTQTVTGTGSLPSANPQGLAFSAAVPADPQRDEAEPLIVSDPAGRLYTCGPTGFSNAADYAQVSTDGGDQFHLLGTPPRGQQTVGGGGDCVVSTGEAKNSAGNYQYAYAGLGALSGFATATSPDDGHTLTPGGFNVAGGATTEGAAADRQWMTFTDASTVLLSYNQQVPRNTVVIKSTDGGLTYSPAASIAAPDPDFPGPMHYIPSLHTVVMPWTKGEQVNLAISQDDGTTWTECKVGPAPGGTAGFATADVDSAGNVYVAWADSTDYHTWLAALPAAGVTGCNQSIADVSATTNGEPTVDPGWTKPLQMDRDAVRTTVFPWVAAGGAPGRAAVAFYGTPVDGDPNTGTFKAAWNVYVSQTLNVFASDATAAQVQATTHPFHYDSICLNGLGCDLATPPGDRSLADFFAITYNRANGRLSVVFDRTNKKPDDAAGYVATPMVTTQIAGPSDGGGTVSVKGRTPLRNTTSDPKGDALAPYSEMGVTPSPANVPAGDFTAASIGPDKATGGFTVTLKLADLSSSALSSAAGAGSLVWIWRFTNGWQDAAAVASWSPVSGFSYGFDEYTTDSGTCGGEGGNKCEIYPGNTPIKGSVDQATGTIRLVVPKSVLHPFSGVDGFGRPKQGAATTGSRFYDGTAFSFENASLVPSIQSWMTQLDNTPAFDFLLGGKTGSGGGGGSGSGGGTGSGGGPGGGGTSGKSGSSSTSVSAASVGAYRLVIDRFAVSPGVISSRRSVQLRVHVSDTHGDSVSGALVYVLGIPTRRIAKLVERLTDGDGWASFTLLPQKALPLRPGGKLALFVRARVPGQPLLGGASIRRLVSVAVNPRVAHAPEKLSPEKRVIEAPVANRLVISRVVFQPKTIQSRGVPLHVRVLVVGSDGKPVGGALVKVIGVPFARVSAPPEATTAASGWATLTLQPRQALPLRRGGLLMLFLRARVPGEPVLAGASTRRLVSVRVR